MYILRFSECKKKRLCKALLKEKKNQTSLHLTSSKKVS